jgi:hypothetical protein
MPAGILNTISRKSISPIAPFVKFLVRLPNEISNSKQYLFPLVYAVNKYPMLLFPYNLYSKQGIMHRLREITVEVERNHRFLGQKPIILFALLQYSM